MTSETCQITAPEFEATDAVVRSWFDGGEREMRRCSIPALGQFIEAHCRERYMVTLTDRRQMRPLDMTRDVAWVLHQTNQAFFGTAYRRHKRLFLATYAVHERTQNDGLHTHIIIGVPNGALELKPNRPTTTVPDFIVQAWSHAAPSYRRPDGQKWEPIWYLAGAFDYVQKDVFSANDIDTVDVMNSKFPTSYDCPPLAGG